MIPLTNDQKKIYAGGLILHHMYHTEKKYDVLLFDNDEKLQPILEWLLMKKLIKINNEHHYELTEAGKSSVKDLGERYQNLLTYIDVFAHVDLEDGEFAFSYFSEFQQTARWEKFIEEPRWDDLRLAIMKYLGGDPEEFVYLQCIEEERFDITSANWQLDLEQGSFWKEIEEISRTAVSVSDLGFEENGVIVSGSEILADIASLGFDLLRELHPDDLELHRSLHTWYPQHGVMNSELSPLEGLEKTPIWEKKWIIE